MSKSWGNAIRLDDSPNDIHGKIMSIKDELIPEYFLLATKLPVPDVSDPMLAKKQLAFQIVKELHSENDAKQAEKYFESTFQQKQTPQDIPTISVTSKNIVDVLIETQLASSKSEAKRLIEQKGVRIDNAVVSNIQFLISNNQIVNVGSRKFVKVQIG